MLPIYTARIGCFNYKIEVHDESVSDNHGDTCREKKKINLFYNGNIEVLKETLHHEIMHTLAEDVFKTIKDIEDLDEKEEQFIRIYSPRMVQFMQDNPELVEFIMGEDNEEE